MTTPDAHTSTPAAGTHRIFGEDGLSVDVLKSFVRAPELEIGSVRLAAVWESWNLNRNLDRLLRPTLTVEVTELTPECCTLPQLSLRTMAAQIAKGRTVIACNLPPDVDLEQRWIQSTYQALDSTIVQLQVLALRGEKAAVVSMECDAIMFSYGNLAVIAGKTLNGPFGERPSLTPVALPALDGYVRERCGLELEDLSQIRNVRPRSAGRVWAQRDRVKVLERGKVRKRDDIEALRLAGFVGHDRNLTELGERAHQVFAETHLQLTVEVRTDQGPDKTVLTVYQGPDDAVVVDFAAPGEAAAGAPPQCSVELVDSRTLPVVIARWLGISPAWSFSVDAEPELFRSIDLTGNTFICSRNAIEARIANRGAPAPDDATPTVRRLWEQPWQFVRLISNRMRGELGSVIVTPQTGAYYFQRIDSKTVRLGTLPASHFFFELLPFTSFQVYDPSSYGKAEQS